MVTVLQAFLVMIVAQEGRSVLEEIFPQTPPPDIVAVRKATKSETVLKPCHALTVVFEVTLAAEAMRTQWPKIARHASRLVRINKHEYRNMLSEGSTNTACAFDLLWPEASGPEPPPPSSAKGLISATCQFDLKQRSCLFDDPGDYGIEFYLGDQTLDTTVRVLPPTPNEMAIVEELNKLPMILLLASPTNRDDATPDNIAKLEQLVALESDYSRMLSLTLGLAKGQRVGRPLWTDMTVEEQHEELEERLALLGGVLDGELKSRLEGLAAGELFRVTTQLARLTDVPDKRAELSKISKDTLTKLAACPLVPNEQALARSVLEQMK